MIFIAATFGGLGLVCMLMKRTLLGVMVGIQLLFLGAGLLFVYAGAMSGVQVKGHLFGLFITWSGIAQLVVGYALAVRLFYLKSRVTLDETRTLKH